MDKKPLLMGILNASKESFYDGEKRVSFEEKLSYGLSMLEKGADLIDIGGESSKPGSTPISFEEEYARVVPLLEKLKGHRLSIDTSKPEIAKVACDLGVSMINDITALCNPHMQEIVSSYGVKAILMHMQGKPKTMQNSPHYPEGVVEHLLNWFDKRINEVLKKGVKESQIIIDPGWGFGKTIEHNFSLLFSIHRLQSLGFPIAIGLSRKSSLGKIVNKPPEDLLYGTLALNAVALFQGVDLIRVHDVEAHRQMIDLISFGKKIAQ